MPLPRFEDPGKYESYLKTTEGRLRCDLAWENLCTFLPADPSGRRALDLGAGTGATGIRLARIGFAVVLLDSAAAMLDLARGCAEAAHLGAGIQFVHADAARLPHLFPAQSFDVLVCHNLLEYVEDAPRVVRDMARLLADGGVASILVRNRYGEVMKAAVLSGDIEQAVRVLTENEVRESLYGGTVRVFTPRDTRSLVEGAGLDLVAERGVRVISDYVKATGLPEDGFRRLLEAELAFGSRQELSAIARYTQVIAQAKRR